MVLNPGAAVLNPGAAVVNVLAAAVLWPSEESSLATDASVVMAWELYVVVPPRGSKLSVTSSGLPS